MTSNANTPEEYINELPKERKEVIQKITAVIQKKLPVGFEARMGSGMLSYHVPHKIYPGGYHCNPELPLPFINVASQKNFVALYHMGIYANKELLNWLVAEFPRHSSKKLDMGKCCIRFKNLNEIPYELIGLLVTKMTSVEWIELYEKNVKR